MQKTNVKNAENTGGHMYKIGTNRKLYKHIDKILNSDVRLSKNKKDIASYFYQVVKRSRKVKTDKYLHYPELRLHAFLKMADNFDIFPLLETMGELSVPKRIFLWKIDKDLSKMTYGERLEILNAYEQGDIFYSAYKVFTNIPTWVIRFVKIKNLYPFVKMVIDNLHERIKRDKALVLTPTVEEKKAGIDKLQFGIFGMLDAIVLRLYGNIKHEEVQNMLDTQVFNMLYKDAKTVEFQRAYQKVIEEKQKSAIKKQSNKAKSKRK